MRQALVDNIDSLVDISAVQGIQYWKWLRTVAAIIPISELLLGLVSVISSLYEPGHEPQQLLGMKQS
jgi:hypothetical protein